MAYEETIIYIKKHIKDDHTPENVKKALTESGYNSDLVEDLMKRAGVKQKHEKSSGIETLFTKNKKIIAAALIIIVLSLGYLNFFQSEQREFLSPGKDANLILDLSKLSPLDLQKNGIKEIDLSKYVKDKNNDISQLRWSSAGSICVNMKTSRNKMTLRSIFLSSCPDIETVILKVTNPSGVSSSDELKIKIRD